MVFLRLAAERAITGGLVIGKIVIPSIGVKDILQQWRSQRVADVIATHAGLDLGELILGHQVSLLDIDAMDAKSRTAGEHASRCQHDCKSEMTHKQLS